MIRKFRIQTKPGGSYRFGAQAVYTEQGANDAWLIDDDGHSTMAAHLMGYPSRYSIEEITE